MKLFNNILGKVGLQRKYSAVGALMALYNLGRPIWTPRRYDQFAEEGYQKNVIAYACVREISTGAASVPFVLYRRRGDRLIEITDHPLLTLLKRPNPTQGGGAFMKGLYGYFLIAGNSYIEGVAPDRRPPRELYAHRPDRIKVIPGGFGLPAGFEYAVNGSKKVWDVDPISGTSPILHLKTFNPLNDWYGMSPIEAAAYSIDTHNAAGAWNKSLIDNGARPSGALVAPGHLTDPQFKRLNEEIVEKYTGKENAGKPFLFEGGLDWKEMGLSPKDMDYINSKNTSARDTALAYGVPPMILGIPGDNTYSNYKEARLALWDETILPLVFFLCDEFNNWLTPAFGNDLALGIDEDRISALAPRREKVWERVKNADYLTINEKREAVGYEHVDGGDVIFVSAAQLPLGFDIEDQGKKSIEFKLVNDNSPKERAREWAIQMRLMAGFEASLEGRTSKLLDAQSEKTAKAFKSDGILGVEFSLKDHGSEVDQLLRAHYHALMAEMGRRVMDGFKSMPGAYETKGVVDIFEKLLQEWIEKYTVKKVQGITDTTRSFIKDAIEAGEAAGESIEKIADMIRAKVGGDFAKMRAKTIARTETHSAAVAANDGAAEATGLNLKRSWLSARTENTRDSHLLADGQVRGMKEAFDVGGYKLMRPGDPNAPADEIVNCRCVITYIPQES